MTDEDTEKQVEQDVTAGTDEPKGPADVTEAAKQAEYDKAQQQIDQERANARRAREALEEAESEKEQMSEQLATVQGQMADLQKQLKEQLTAKEYKDLANLDPDTTDVPDLVKAFQVQSAKLHELARENAEMKEYLTSLRTRDQQAQQQAAHAQMEEEIYSACDKDFGPQHRNDAIKLADQWVNEGAVDRPVTPVQGLMLMQRAYRETAKRVAPKPEPKKSVPTDTGLRGLSVTDLKDHEQFKAGPLDEVAADMRKKMKDGKWDRKAFATPP